jgi:hypothetical protein
MPQPHPPDGETASTNYTLPPRGPKVWVVAVLAPTWLVCVNLGFGIWYRLDQPGKDPQLELAECGFVGLLVATVAYSVYFKRTWRLTLPMLLVAALLGFLTGLSAVALHLVRFGWY